MELWMVSIPVKGYNPKGEEVIQHDKVVFHQSLDPYGRKMFLGSTVLEGKQDSVRDNAIELIDNALTKLSFATASMLTLDDSEYYLTPVKDVDKEGISKLDQGTIHRTGAGLIVRYRTGEDRTKAIFSDIRHLNPVLNQARQKY